VFETYRICKPAQEVVDRAAPKCWPGQVGCAKSRQWIQEQNRGQLPLESGHGVDDYQRSGQRADWPVAEVSLSLDGTGVTTPCFIAPDGPALLGAVALESLFLAVDPLAKRLIPVEGFVGAAL